MIETLAESWSSGVLTNDTWTPTGRKWGTNSQPLEVINASNLRGVAKPGSLIADRCLRAAHEKIVSDLAYVLELPVPPVILWDRGDGFVGDRHCAISAWAFPAAVEWPTLTPTPEQRIIAQAIAGAMRVFDTWVAASDRRDDHILANDDGNTGSLGLAYIDYAFSLTYEWCGISGKGGDPRPSFPSGVQPSPKSISDMIEAIEKFEEPRIAQIVNRVPAGYFSGVDGAKDVIVSSLIDRRKMLRGWLI